MWYAVFIVQIELNVLQYSKSYPTWTRFTIARAPCACRFDCKTEVPRPGPSKRAGLLVVLPRPVDRAEPAEGELDLGVVRLDAALPNAQLARTVQPNKLIVALAMALLQPDDGGRLPAERVHALLLADVLQLAPLHVRRQHRVLVQHVVRHVVHVPLEALALQPLLQRQLLADVAHVEEAGERLARTWPTREHGTHSMLPPHCQILKLSSKFSPPQTSRPESYAPSSRKNFRLMANRPPAWVGLRYGSLSCLRRFCSRRGTSFSLYSMPHSKMPR
uniref:Uncharacterized protein n=1 Tax=Anopheles merus TaxID=30066 RepID=A0A182UT60_ANOME